MKQAITENEINKYLQRLVVTVVLILTLLAPVELMAQTDSTKKEEPAAKEESAMISPSIEFKSIQKGDNTIELVASMKAKIKGSFIKLPLLKVTFFQISDTAEKELGFVISDRVGKAVFNSKPGLIQADKEGKLHFKAVFAGNKQMDAAEEELTVKSARLVMIPVKEDSVLTVKVKLVDMSTGTETPVPETALGIFVKRQFNPLKVGEGTTDENGDASVEIPNNLPGDPKGNITLLAKLDENEVYGNLETSVVQKWGIPVSDKLNELPRALWSAHPPVWMMVTFAILMITVWGHYIVIIFELFRLRKEEPHAPVKKIIV